MVPPLRVELVAGGLSPAGVWKLTTAEGEYTLRRWPQAHVAAREPGLVSVPLPEHSGGSLLAVAGEHWGLSPWLPGLSDFAEHPSLERVVSAAEALVRLHQALSAFTPNPVPSERVTEKCERQLAQVKELLNEHWPSEGSDILRQWGWPANLLPAERTLRRGCDIAARLLVPLRSATFAHQWIWGDAWHRNFLFEGSRVTGLVDFSAARIDVPAADLARLLGSTCSDQDEWRAAGLASYERVRPLSAEERNLTTVLERVATVVSLGNWCRWLAIEKQAVAHPQEARDRLLHFTRRLARLLEDDQPLWH
jgi:Ser/Thr protein kinase RdoA (MazF antagonist)